MSTYREWNNAILSSTMRGIPRGEYVFLSIDEEAIEIAGQQFKKISRPDEGWVDDFKRAIRGQCIARNRIQIKRVMNPLRTEENIPRYVGFLSAMILAGHYMGEDKDKGVHNSDYFTHLNNVFGLDPDTNRAGMDSGAEMPLWEDWKNWLRSQGYLPSLKAGEGKYKYIGYPISQALLRQSDKDRLWRLFGERNWSRHLDEDILIAHIRANQRYLNSHLQELLDTQTPRGIQIYDSLKRACYNTYEAWVEAGAPRSSIRAQSRSTIRVMRAGILRQMDHFAGTRDYFLFPKQPSGAVLEDARILYRDEKFTLLEERPGWFSPLWELDADDLDGIQVDIETDHPTIERLELPGRDFWILTLDPEVPESEVFASWRSNPVLGEPFVLLCRNHLKSAIQRLQKEGLIEFDSKPVSVWDGWSEYEDVFISSEPDAWNAINLPEETLLQALKPRISFKLGLSGGLRAPGTGGWIVGHGPDISVSAFFQEVQLEIIDPENDTVIYQVDNFKTGTREQFHWDTPGNYVVAAGRGNFIEERIVQIVAWESLQIAPPLQEIPQTTQQNYVFGAIVREY